MNKLIEWLAIVLGAIVLVIIISLILAVPTMLLWNWLMPAIFGITKLTFLEAWGVNFLTGILFKSTSTKTS